MCAVTNCSPAVCPVRFAWLGVGRVGTESVPQWVELSSPHPTVGSRNLDLQVCSPIKTEHFLSLSMFTKIHSDSNLQQCTVISGPVCISAFYSHFVNTTHD